MDKQVDAYCYEAVVPGVVAGSALPRLKAFAHTSGEVTKLTPLWAHVGLTGGAEGRIHITDARDMYSRLDSQRVYALAKMNQ